MAHWLIWAQLMITCVAFADAGQQRLPVFRVDTQARSAFEIGAELGRQWKNQFPQIEPQLDALLAHRLKQITLTDENGERAFSSGLKTTSVGLTEQHREELEGLMSALHLVSRNRLGDGFLSRDELLLIQRLADLGAQDSGTAFGVYAGRSETGGALLGRNLDGRPRQPPMERALQAITVYQGEDGSLVNIGFAGSLGVTTGFNQGGLFLAYLPVLDMPPRTVAGLASEPIAFSMRRVLETQERIDAAAEELIWPIDANNYSILMADRERVKVLEHSAARHARLREPGSESQAAMSWHHKQKIAAVGCFALREMPSGCSSLREQYRWQRFRTLADLDLQGRRFTLEDMVQIMLDRVGSNDAIYAPSTYQTLVFAPATAELYLGGQQPADRYKAEPIMHRYADLVAAHAQKGKAISTWLWLWLLILAIASVTLWVRLRLRSSSAEA